MVLTSCLYLVLRCTAREVKYFVWSRVRARREREEVLCGRTGLASEDGLRKTVC